MHALNPARRAPRWAAALLALLAGCGAPQKTEQPPETARPVAPASVAAATPPPAPVPTAQVAAPTTEAAAQTGAPDEVEAALAYNPKDPLANLEAADALNKCAAVRTAT